MNMTISVVTATRNQQHSLPLLLGSLVPQMNLIKEWIIVDDGSTDGTSDLIDQYTKIKKVKAFHHPHNGFRYAEISNLGMKAATGDVIFLVNGDSYLYPNTIQCIHDSFVYGSAGSGQRINVDAEGNFVSLDWRHKEMRDDISEITKEEEPWKLLTGNTLICGKTELEKVGYFNEEYIGYGREDWDLFLRLKRIGVRLFQYNNIKVNHINHEPQPENPESIQRFFKELHEGSIES